MKERRAVSTDGGRRSLPGDGCEALRAIRDGRTSSEIIKKTHAEIMRESKGWGDDAVPQENEAQGEEFVSEELIVLDRTGRLQLPKEYLEALEIKGGSRVKADLDKEEERIYIRKAE